MLRTLAYSASSHPFSVCVLCMALAAVARAQAPFCETLKALTTDAGVASAHWGVSVTTLDGRPLCGINDAQLFRPASNAKLFTATAALGLLGPNATVKTVVTGQPPLAGEIHGDLTLVGAGDGFLSRRALPYTHDAAEMRPANRLAQLADDIAALGVLRVTGDVVGNDAAWPAEPYPPDWSSGDRVWGYGAPVSALTVDDNKLTLTVTPGAAVGTPAAASLVTQTELYSLQVDVVTLGPKAASLVQVEREPGSRTVQVSGAVAAGSPYVDDLAIEDPALYAAQQFRQMLEARGVQVEGTARAQHSHPAPPANFETAVNRPIANFAANPTRPQPGAVLATLTSPTLLEEVTVTLKVSQNLHAELLLHRLGQIFGDDASTAQGVRVVRQFALHAGVAKDDLYLNDGSGLSTHDLATPRALTQLLVFAAKQPWFQGFHSALPIAGVDGSLASRFPPPGSTLKGRVFAKTGTLGESRALSGYVLAGSGKTLVLSILNDDHLPGSNADRTVMDHMVEIIAAQN